MAAFLHDQRAQVAALRAASRINVVGNSGSGKSTFAQHLARLKGCAWIELDGLYWGPDWREPPDTEFLPNIEGALSAPAWVLDGNYSRSEPVKWPVTQLVVVLEVSRLVNLIRIVKRSTLRWWRQETLWSGNRESLARSLLSKESVVYFSIGAHARVKRRYRNPQYFAAYPHLQVLYMPSSSHAEACLRALELPELSQQVHDQGQRDRDHDH